jgi:hypothetical protein
MSNAGRRTQALFRGAIPTSASQSSGVATSDPRVIVNNVFSPQISNADASDGGMLELHSPLVGHSATAPLSTLTLPVTRDVTTPVTTSGDDDVTIPDVVTPEVTEHTATAQHEAQPRPPHELEDLDGDLVDNANLKRFRARNTRNAEFTINVDFLKNVIRVLLTNHSITITSQDIHDIMAFFGEVEIRTKKRKIVEREVDPEAGCCGLSKQQKESIIEVIQKILVLGINISKYCPQLVEFLHELGINI